MLRYLRSIPVSVYLASLIGGAAVTYILYPITKEKRRNSRLAGYPRGLINCKNDCFINVILQSLSASEKVTKWLVGNKSNSNLLFDTLADIVIRINRLELVDDDKLNVKIESSDEHEFYAAQSFKRALNAHNWSIKSEEHDCHELFQLIMDVLDEEQAESKKSLKSLNYFTPSHLKENSSSSKSSFHGYFVNQLQCLDCNYKYPLRLESFNCLSLTLPTHKNSSVTLAECINNYFKSDHITGMKCENCGTKKCETSISNKNKKGFIKRQAIAKLPECLAIQIQRNSWSEQCYEMVKQMSYVQFPQNIKIDNPVVTKPSSSTNQLTQLLSQYSNNQFSLKQVGIGGLLGGNIKTKTVKKSSVIYNQQTRNISQHYDLKSAIVHYGNARSGHFVAYRKPLATANSQKPDEWLQISDSDIKKCKKYELFSSNVYMLFYDKISVNKALC